MAIIIYYSEPEEAAPPSSGARIEDGLLAAEGGPGFKGPDTSGERTPMIVSPHVGRGHLHSIEKHIRVRAGPCFVDCSLHDLQGQ